MHSSGPIESGRTCRAPWLARELIPSTTMRSAVYSRKLQQSLLAFLCPPHQCKATDVRRTPFLRESTTLAFPSSTADSSLAHYSAARTFLLLPTFASSASL